MTSANFVSVNPNTGAAPVFRTRRDGEITTAIYSRQPVLVDRCAETTKKIWPVKYATMFHMTNDSHLFKRRDELERDGWYPVGGNRWKKGEAEALPLYEGKMVQAYDHRAANVVVNASNLHRPAQQVATTEAHHSNPAFVPAPQFYLNASDVDATTKAQWILAYKSITAPTNMRTMIAAMLPRSGLGNSMATLLPETTEHADAQLWLPLLLANLSSIALDFVLRQKVQGQNLNWFIVEQLPMIRPEQFETRIGNTTISDFIRNEVLRLSYTAHDLASFARDLGFDGPPFAWDAEDRRHRIARLDALFFRLYGLGRDDAAYVMDTFPIVREQDVSAHGRYLTKDLVLAYMNAIDAGDLTSIVQP